MNRDLAMLLGLLMTFTLRTAFGQEAKDLGIQLPENPPMRTISRTPTPPITAKAFKVSKGFYVLDTLDEFRAAIKKNGQKTRINRVSIVPRPSILQYPIRTKSTYLSLTVQTTISTCAAWYSIRLYPSKTGCPAGFTLPTPGT